MLHHIPQQQRLLPDGRDRVTGARQRSAGAAELERVVMAAAQSNSWAWAALMDRYGERVRRVARRHRLAPHDVDDVAQATWMRLFEHIGTIREPRAIGGWLETTARRESLRVLHANGHEQPTEDEQIQLPPVEPVNEQRLVAAAQHSLLQASLENLTERQCALMRSLLTEPAPPYAEIALSLGMAQGSIGPTRQRCLERLRADKPLAAWCAA